MSARQVVPPAALSLAVSMLEAQTAARVDAGEDGKSALDGEIQRAIRTYTTEAELETSRAVMQQTWRLTLDSFPVKIELVKPPLLRIVHIKFYDADGVQKVLAAEDYFVDSEAEPGCILPAPGTAWPATAMRKNAVEVQFECGYGTDHTSVPDAISGFIIARLQEHFDSAGQPKNEHVRRLLWDLKVYP